jgi:rubrerythrin
VRPPRLRAPDFREGEVPIVSRLPRAQEFLKTGFNAEAASAARLRAAASRAEREGKHDLSRALKEMAAEKDSLAIAQLEAAGLVRDAAEDLAAAVAEERYENEALYPRMASDVDGATAEVFRSVIALQKEHAAKLEALLGSLVGTSAEPAA